MMNIKKKQIFKIINRKMKIFNFTKVLNLMLKVNH